MRTKSGATFRTQEGRKMGWVCQQTRCENRNAGCNSHIKHARNSERRLQPNASVWTVILGWWRKLPKAKSAPDDRDLERLQRAHQEYKQLLLGVRVQMSSQGSAQTRVVQNKHSSTLKTEITRMIKLFHGFYTNLPLCCYCSFEEGPVKKKKKIIIC